VARARPFQNNFSAGEFSPRLEGRTDLSRYANAVKTLENFVAQPHGGVKRRAGTHFVAEMKDSAVRGRLIPFEFSDTQAYVLEFGNLYVRFYMNMGQILDGGPAYEIVSPYVTADLAKLKFVQSADVMYLVHPSYQPRKLTRTGHTAWTLTKITFLPPPTAEELFKPAATLTPSATTGTNILFTASAAVFLKGDINRHIISGVSRATIQVVDTTSTVHADILDDFPDTNPISSGSWGLNGSPNKDLTPDKNGPVGAVVTLDTGVAGTDDSFRSTDVGKYVKLNDGIVKLTQFVDATTVKGEIIKGLTAGAGGAPEASKAGTWTLEIEAWSAARGFPAAISFHEGRLDFAGTFTQPSTVWGSASGDFENFALGTQAGDAYEFGIAANKVNIIRWLLPSRVLLVGTKGGEFRVTGGADLPITPTNVDAKSETAYGSTYVNPARVGSAILFVTRSGRKVRELAFSLDFDSYVAPDLTVLAEHMVPPGSDGMLCALSYDRSNDVVGWHRHPMDGVVESVCVIPHPDGDREQVWIAIKRTINSVTKRYVEYMDDAGGFYDDLQTDSTLTYSGAPATTFGGLEHLRGKVVAILGDGAYYGEQTVPTSGAAQVVISPAASDVEVGLPYVSTLGTLRQEIASQVGTTQGRKKRQAEVVVRVLDTMGITINGYPQPARRSTDLLGSPPSLFTGDYVGTQFGWNTEGRNLILQTLPFPANILGIFGAVDLGDA
jgi:hypothetical protein